MNQPLVEHKTGNGIARVTLNRPDKRNALSRRLIGQLQQAVDSVQNDPGARLLVLTGEGPVFCAGMDLAEMQDRAGQPDASEQWHRDTSAYHDLLVSLFRLPLPTLAVVQGPAVAGGLGLVLACDMVLAAETATFSLPEPRRGITAAVVAPLLIYRIGVGAASHLLLSGQTLPAADALRIGLCHQAVPGGQLRERIDDLIASICTGSPAALATTKRHIIDTAGAQLSEQMQAAMHISATARETADAREGLAAFLERRNPNWTL